MSKCNICPRQCGADRTNGKLGFCGVSSDFKIARAALHHWEEPVISGSRGSGAIFFSGCSLRCVFCQNKRVSSESLGKTVLASELEDIIFSLEKEGAHNINLVTPSHYTAELVPLLEKIKQKLKVPIVWNSSAYESKSTLKMLDGLVDIYLPDLKYFSPELSKAYSAAPDYFENAIEAIKEMKRQCGNVTLNPDGTLKKGIIVRHLVLPGCRKDSLAVLNALKNEIGTDGIYLSLMNQYTPEFAIDCDHKNLHRRVTSFEYDSACRLAETLGFDGFFQDRAAATSDFTPKFFGE